ncbi:hypothetical protein BHYA_0002g00770 [Botrytis hyacinthi]|uniref:Uncharacterized protein n=1 Tax=Botrytis hyacinthi TaxID=278943 RepID=A0A4Z1H703_9HELO|nr:hypothetical protein BHYA_0002g00770 [Botrytis hyacinthi]
MPSIAQEDWDIPSMDFHMSTNGAVNLLKRRRDVANFTDVRDEEVQMKINRSNAIETEEL